jgi:hypothetical protein
MDNFLPLTTNPATATQGYVNSGMTAIMMVCALVILVEAGRRWYRVLVRKEIILGGKVYRKGDAGIVPPEFGCS